MNENFEDLSKRLKSADPATDAVISESVVAQAALSSGTKAPLSTRFRRLILSSGAVASVGAMALVVSLALPQQPLIEMAANSAGAPLASSQGAAESDAKMIWPGYFQYEYDSSALSNETGSGSVYQLVLTGSPEQRLREVAQVFKLQGEIRPEDYSTDQYPAYRIGSDSEMAGIYWSGTGNWYYSFWDSKAMRCEMKTIELEDGSSYESCEPILTPELVPSVEQMRATAQQVFSQLGLVVDADSIRVERSDWGGSANAGMVVDGEQTALEWGLSWDGAGRLSYAFGHSVEVVKRGEFKTVSAVEAAARIKDGRWYGSPASSNYNFAPIGIARAEDSVAVAPDQPVEAIDEPAVEGSTDSEPGTKPEVDPGVEPGEMPEPEIVTLKLVSSKSVLLMIYDQNGSAWLVPGYLLTNEQGWFDSIISLEEGVIALPEPIDYEIMPYIEGPATKQD